MGIESSVDGSGKRVSGRKEVLMCPGWYVLIGMFDQEVAQIEVAKVLLNHWAGLRTHSAGKLGRPRSDRPDL
jgi:hypothetical protein